MEWLYGEYEDDYAFGIPHEIVVHAVNKSWEAASREYASVNLLMEVGKLILECSESEWESVILTKYGKDFEQIKKQLDDDLYAISLRHFMKFELNSAWKVIADYVIYKTAKFIEKEHPYNSAREIKPGSQHYKFISQCVRYPVSPYVFGAIVLFPLLDSLKIHRMRAVSRCIGPESLLEKLAIWHNFQDKEIYYSAYPITNQNPDSEDCESTAFIPICSCAFANSGSMNETIIKSVYKLIINAKRFSAYEIQFEDPYRHENELFVVAIGYEQVVLMGMPNHIPSDSLVTECVISGVDMDPKNLARIKAKALLEKSGFVFVESKYVVLRSEGSGRFSAHFHTLLLH